MLNYPIAHSVPLCPVLLFVFEPHLTFKQRVPKAIGLIRTGDTIEYANVILESG